MPAARAPTQLLLLHTEGPIQLHTNFKAYCNAIDPL